MNDPPATQTTHRLPRTLYQKYPQEGTFDEMILYISRCSNNENELSFSKMSSNYSQFEDKNNMIQIVHRYLYIQHIRILPRYF